MKTIPPEGLPILKRHVASSSPAAGASAMALAKMGDDGVRVLKGALLDESARTRPHVVTALSMSEGGLEVLVEALPRLNSRDRSSARRLIERAGAKALPVLASRMESRDPLVRISTARLLRRLGRPALPVLLEHLDDPDVRVRTQIVEALAVIRDPRALVGLAKAMSDSDVSIVRLARASMGRMRAHRVPDLVKALEDPPARRIAESRLVSLGREAVPGLIKILATGETTERRNAAWILGRIGDWARPAVPHLVKAFQDPEVARAAIKALGEIGPGAKAAVPSLERLAKDSEYKHAARNALKRIRSGK